MRLFAFAMLGLALSAQVAMAVPTSGSKTTKLVLKKEIVDRCGGYPYAPTLVLDAKTVTAEEMQNAREDVMEFLYQADNYQACLDKIVETFAARLTDNEKIFLVSVYDKVQSEKETLGNDFNKLVDEYDTRRGIKPKKPAAQPAAATKPAKPQ